MLSTCRTCRKPRRLSASHRAKVALAEHYVQCNRHRPLPVSRLCRIVGLSERALRNAFYEVHGVGPKRWMLGARLEDVHRALSSARNRSTTVTGIATAYGFYELGRFAAAYRAAFGESPSATLRISRDSSAQTGNVDKGLDDVWTNASTGTHGTHRSQSRGETVTRRVAG